jgi:mannose-6-phosphate isomerase class I
VFDWNRVDNNGTSRELHIEQALQSIDFEDVQPTLSQVKGELLITNKLFEVQKWNLDEPRETTPLGQFAIVCCISGCVRCCDMDLLPGEFFVIAAQLPDRKLKAVEPDTTLLRVTIPV